MIVNTPVSQKYAEIQKGFLANYNDRFPMGTAEECFFHLLTSAILPFFFFKNTGSCKVFITVCDSLNLIDSQAELRYL